MDKINIPAWNHFPFLGYLHYRNHTSIKFVHTPQRIWLPPLNPYLGFINHAVPALQVVEAKSFKAQEVNAVVETRDIGTQTEPNRAMELGQQIIDKMGYE